MTSYTVFVTVVNPFFGAMAEQWFDAARLWRALLTTSQIAVAQREKIGFGQR